MTLKALQRAGLGIEILLAYTKLRVRLGRADSRRLAAIARQRSWFVAAIPGATTRQQAGYLNHAVNRLLSVLPTDARCLIQALVLCRLLAARGIASKIVVGAAFRPDFMAHAWVEIDGRAVSPVRGFDDARLFDL